MATSMKSFAPVGNQVEVSLADGNVLVSDQIGPGVDAYTVMLSGGSAEYRMDGQSPASSTNFLLEEDKVVLIQNVEDWALIFKQTAGVTLVLQPGELK